MSLIGLRCLAKLVACIALPGPGTKKSSSARGGTWKDVAEEGGDMADGGNQWKLELLQPSSPFDHMGSWFF